MIYYIFIAAAAVMFGLQFFFNKIFQKNEGVSSEKSLVFSLGTSVIIFVAMFAANGFVFEFSRFSLAVSVIMALNGILFNYCSVISMSKVNLSLYSLLAMLGGMLLPFVAGICFWREELTVKKLLAAALIGIALFIGVKLKTGAKSLKYCFFVFILNGMSGVISKWHQSYTEINVSSEGFMILKSLVTIIICLFIIPFYNKNKLRLNNVKSAVFSITAFGLMTGFANLLVLTALVHIAASVQYPMITGGTIIVSTLICFFTREKITYKNILSAGLATVASFMLM